MQGPRLVLLGIALAVAIAASLASASVFVYYPLTVNVQYTPPPVKFEAGSNAGQPDLSGTIDVSIGQNQTLATITIHPTYRTTYYKDVLHINNTSSSNYYIMLRVDTPASIDISGATLELRLVDDTGRVIKTLDLTQTGDTGWLLLNAGSGLRVDIVSDMPEGYTLPSSVSASISLIYSNSNTETPP